MKINIIMVALIAVSGSAFAQDKWVELGTNHTDLALAQEACQAKDINYQVPTIEYLNNMKTLKRENRLALVEVVATAFGAESKKYRRYRYTSPYFLADDNGVATEAKLIAYATGVRISNIDIQKRGFEPYIFEFEDEPRATATAQDRLDNALTDWLFTPPPGHNQFIVTPPDPLINMCVQSEG